MLEYYCNGEGGERHVRCRGLLQIDVGVREGLCGLGREEQEEGRCVCVTCVGSCIDWKPHRVSPNH